MRVRVRDRVSLEVLHDAHRVVAALPRPVDTEREARTSLYARLISHERQKPWLGLGLGLGLG